MRPKQIRELNPNIFDLAQHAGYNQAAVLIWFMIIVAAINLITFLIDYLYSRE